MPKVYLPVNVLEAARQRVAYLFDEFTEDELWLSFSGGKDSTVCYHLMREEAIRRGRGLRLLCIDLEGHYKAHEDFVRHVFDDPIVTGYWVCLPFNLSNASSFHQPKWLCWDEREVGRWVRPMPEHSAVVHQGNHPFGDHFREGMEFEEFILSFPSWLIGQGARSVAQVIGIRTQESYNRYMKIKVKQHREFYRGRAWVLRQKSVEGEAYSAHPIYDWDVKDVWKYSSTRLYNTVYDKMYLAGYPLNSMRICQPYGEEQRDNIDLFAKIEPETWARISQRVHGANFAKVYRGKNVIKGRIQRPDGTTWEEWARLILRTMPPYLREHFVRRINVFLRWWRKEIYQDIPHVYSKELADNEQLDDDGLYVVKVHDEHPDDTAKKQPSWRRIAKVLVKGDYLCKNLTFCANKNEYEKLEALKQKWMEAV